MRRFAWLLLLGIAAAARGEWQIVAPPELRPALQSDLRRLLVSAQGDALLRELFESCRARGYPWARCALDSAAQRVHVEPGPRARIVAIEWRGEERPTARVFRLASGLREGQEWLPSSWPAAARRGLLEVAERGHPFATAHLQAVEGDPQSGDVRLAIWFDSGEEFRVGSARLFGATHTRESTLLRLARIPFGERFRESSLRRIRARLLARDVIAEVEAVEALRGQEPGEVDLLLRVRQAPRSGSVRAALGVVRERQGESARVSGAVDLAFWDLFGTARRFEGHWLDDGRARRRLDLEYREPLIFASPLDLRLALGQRHQDEAYDTVLGVAELSMPIALGPQLEAGVALERTAFVGDLGRVRTRQQLRLAVSVRRARPLRGFFGALRSGVSAARVRESGLGAEDRPAQTLLDLGLEGGYAPSSRWAGSLRAHWESVESEETVLPESEWLRLGGATTVRGYSEEQFPAQQMAYGGAELALGPPGRGQVYGFFDLGWARLRRESGVGERWLHGFGLGLRSPLASGHLDLSLGFAEEIRFETGKLHLALRQEF